MASDLDPIEARALGNLRSMISDIQFGRKEIEMDARFLDALSQFYEEPIASEFFDAVHANVEIESVSVELFVFENNTVVMERLGCSLCTLSKLSKVKITVLDGVAVIPAAAAMWQSLQQIRHLE